MTYGVMKKNGEKLANLTKYRATKKGLRNNGGGKGLLKKKRVWYQAVINGKIVRNTNRITLEKELLKALSA